MPTLSSSNRTQARYKLEGLYPANFGVVQAGNGQNFNMTGESLTFDIKTEMSKVLRNDRLIAGHTQVGASASGDIMCEHQYRQYDWAYESIMGSAFTAYGANGVTGTAIATLTPAANTLTAGAAPTGQDAFTTLDKGQWFTIVPQAAASAAVKAYCASRAFRVSTVTAPTSTVITLDAATPIDTAILSAALTNAKISTSRCYTGLNMWSYTVEIAHTDVNLFRVYRGMIPSKFNWKLSVGAIVAGSISFLGKDMINPLPTSTQMGTPAAALAYDSANATRGVFDILENGTSISASTYIKSADITFDASLRNQEAVGVFGIAGIAPGTFKISGTLELYFADATLYNKFLAGQATSLTIPVLDSAGNGYVYYFPKFIYSSAKVNAGGQDQDNTLSVTFECDFDSDPTSPTYQKAAAIYRVGA